MVSSEARRTLIKSPLELWDELSDPASLARHLGEFGEIQITRADPEKKLEWASETMRGTIELLPSGWGTKVVLTAAAEQVSASEAGDAVGATDAAKAADDAASTTPVEPIKAALHEVPDAKIEAAPDPEDEDQPVREPDRISEPPDDPKPDPEPLVAGAAGAEQPPAEPELVAEAPASVEPERRPGFFARLFRRRSKGQAIAKGETSVGEGEPKAVVIATPEPEAIVITTPEAAASSEVTSSAETPPPEPEAAAETAPPEPPVEPAPSLADELATIERLTEEQAKAVLVAVLDRLGAAHHRPFSRS